MFSEAFTSFGVLFNSKYSSWILKHWVIVGSNHRVQWEWENWTEPQWSLAALPTYRIIDYVQRIQKDKQSNIRWINVHLLILSFAVVAKTLWLSTFFFSCICHYNENILYSNPIQMDSDIYSWSIKYTMSFLIQFVNCLYDIQWTIYFDYRILSDHVHLFLVC